MPGRERAGLLRRRERTHGEFAAVSRVFAALLAAAPLETFPAEIRYGVVGVYVKLARMSAGNGRHPGHSEDIAGYASLVHAAVKNLCRAERSRGRRASRTRG